MAGRNKSKPLNADALKALVARDARELISTTVKPLTDAELEQAWQQIRDSCVYFFLKALNDGVFASTGACGTILTHAESQLAAIEMRASIKRENELANNGNVVQFTFQRPEPETVDDDEQEAV